MNINEVSIRINNLRQEIWKANYAYFNENKEIIPESVRDSLKQELIKLEEDFPELITPESPTQKVGAPLSKKLPKISHQRRKYSLADIFDLEELKNFDKRIRKFLETDSIEYSVEPKIDGLNITIWYENGKIKRALTRGDGIKGEDVTHTIKTAKNLPLEIPFQGDLEISGECYISIEDFKAIKQKSDEDFANPRNLCAGSVRQLDPKIADERNLRLAFYEAYSNDWGRENTPMTQKELNNFFEQNNIPYQSYLKIIKNKNKLLNFFQMIDSKKFRENFDYDIDGLVIKTHDLEKRVRLGYTAKAARFAAAWKFPAEQKHTILRKVIFQVGRTGAITPVALLDPVNISGSVVSRAILHNANDIEKKDIRIGDTVVIQKAGDIIPQVLFPIIEMRQGTEKEIQFPNKCPMCEALLNREDAVARCHNENCSGRQKRGLIFFATSLKIDGLGEKTIDGLLQLGLIQTPADLWKLESKDLALLPAFKERKINNLLEALEEKKSLTIQEVFMGLNIRFVGEEIASLLEKNFRENFKNIERPQQIKEIMKNMTTEKIESIDGIGEKVAQSLINFFDQKYTKNILTDLENVGVRIASKSQEINIHSVFFGKKYVITGNFREFSRETLKEKIQSLGGKVLSAISSNVDILLCGESPGSKFNKAKALEIEIWNERKLAQNLPNTKNIQPIAEAQKSLF